MSQLNTILQTLKKFKYTNLALPTIIRQQTLNFIIQFDTNLDSLLDINQLNNLFSTLLKPHPDLLQATIQQALSYDNDRDNKLTFNQTLNFIFEIFFADISNKIYNNSNALNQTSFCNLFTSCLSLMGISFNYNEIQQLYHQLDYSKNGYLTLQQYRQFMKGYLGSESHSAALVKGIPLKIQQQYPNITALNTKINRLLISQLKATAMKYDFGRKLNLSIEQLKVFLAQIFGFLINEQQQLIGKLKVNGNNISYENAIKEALLFYTCDLFFRGENKDINEFNLMKFIQSIRNALFFVKAKPSPYDLQMIFKITDTNNDGIISKDQYITMLRKLIQ